jgi:hypothetical protein
MAKVQKDGKFGYVNKSGQEFVAVQYDKIAEFEDGLAKAVLNGKCGFLGMDGKVMIPFESECNPDNIFEEGFSNGYSKFEVKTKKKKGPPVLEKGLMDKEMRTIVPANYEDVGKLSEGLVAVRKKGKWGYVDLNLKIIVPFQYELAWPFKNNLAKVKLNGKLGIIDPAGKLKLTCEYDEIQDPKMGVFVARIGEKYGLLDENGKYLIEPELDEVENPLKDDLLQLSKVGKLAYFNLKTRSFVWKENGF